MSKNLKSKPLISIIMCTHNRSHIIHRAIRSVLGQTFKNFELIVVNDGSTDDTKKVVLSFKDKRIIYLEKAWSGLASSRNAGLKHTRGEYIAYLDDDDVYKSNHLKDLATFLDSHPHIGMAYSDTAYICDKNKLSKKRSVAFDKRRLEISNFMPNCSIMHRKECLYKTGLFDTKIIASSDRDMWLRISDFYKVRYLSKITSIVYMSSSKNLTSRIKYSYSYITKKRILKAKKEARFLEYINNCSIGIIRRLTILKKIKYAFKLSSEFYRTIKNYQTLACLGLCSLASGKFKEAQKFFTRSINKLPNDWEKLDSWHLEDILTIKNGLAKACYHLNRIDDAIKICQEVLKIKPLNLEAKIQLSMCYFGKNLDGTAFNLIKNIKHVSYAHNLRGCFYLKNNKFKRAIKEFRAALALEPNIKAYRYNLETANEK